MRSLLYLFYFEEMGGEENHKKRGCHNSQWRCGPERVRTCITIPKCILGADAKGLLPGVPDRLGI